MKYQLSSFFPSLCLPTLWGFALIISLAACDSGDETEPELNQEVRNSGPVRSVQLKTSGSIVGEFSPADVSKAKLIGRCDSGGFAVFTILFSPADSWRQLGASIQTKDAIKAGQTGKVEIDWVVLTFTDGNRDATEFRGPAEFLIDLNDNAVSRMSGNLKGQIPGYAGMMATEKVDPTRSIEFEFVFDLNFACD